MSTFSKKTIYNIAIFIFIICFVPAIFLVLVSLAMNLDINTVVSHFLFTTIGSKNGLLFILSKTTSLLIVGLGLAIAFRSSVWNIGAEGQMAIGALVTVGICLFVPLPGFLIIILVFLASFFFGGAWGSIAGFLKAKWEVHEIPITLMQNFIALAILSYFIANPWMSEQIGYARTDFIPADTQFPFIIEPLNSTVLIALLLIPLTYYLLNKTYVGYQLEAVGKDRTAAFFAGMNVKKIIVLSMLLSGGLAGIAGASLVLGEYFRGQLHITGNYGYYAIVSVLLARSKPELLIFTSFIVAVILVGTVNLSVVGIPARFAHLLMGILFIASCVPIIFERR